MVDIVESGITFSLDEKNSYHIEKSPEYIKICGKGVSSVEFITFNNDRILFIEAKSSIPKTNKDEIEEFWTQIRSKDIHSALMFYKFITTGATSDMGEGLIEATKADKHIVFLLVLRGFDTAVCGQLSEIYRKKIKDLVSIFCAEVLVINEVQARKYGIVSWK